MTGYRERAKESLPTVLLTLASIIQALALEVFWGRISDESPYLWEANPLFWLGWAQAVAVFFGILVMWVYYANLVMRFRWLPEVRDSVIPFVIGITEFALVETMGPDQVVAWFVLFAFIFVFADWAAQTTFHRAQLEPENAEFFRRFPYNARRRLLPQIVPAVALCGFAAAAAVAAIDGWLVLTCTIVTVGFVVAQLWLQSVYWRRTLAIDDDLGAQPDND